MITPVAPFSRIYNAVDKLGKGRGKVVGKGGRPVPSRYSCLIYSVVGIVGEMAICQSWDVHGNLFSERIPLENLEPFGPEKR
jgi:hypothetical protein